MATRRQAQLIQARAGGAAPLVHANAGAAPHLVSANAPLVHAPTPSRRSSGGGGFGPVVSPGGFKHKPDPNAPAQQGDNFRVFRDRKGNWEVRAGDGKTVLKRGTSGEWDAIIKRGGAGGSLDQHSLAVYRKATGWKSEEEKALDLAAQQRQQKLDDVAAANAEWDRRNSITQKQHKADVAAANDEWDRRNGITLHDKREDVAVANAEWNRRNNITQEQHKADVAAKAEMEAQRRRDDDLQNKLRGGQFRYSQEQLRQWQTLQDEYNEAMSRDNLSDEDKAKVKAEFEKKQNEIRYNPQPVLEQPPDPQGDFEDSIVTDPKTGIRGQNINGRFVPLADASQTPEEIAAAARNKYVLGRVEGARKTWQTAKDAWDGAIDKSEMTDPGDFDVNAAIASAQSDYDAVYGGGAVQPPPDANPDPDPAASSDGAKSKDPYDRWK